MTELLCVVCVDECTRDRDLMGRVGQGETGLLLNKVRPAATIHNGDAVCVHHLVLECLPATPEEELAEDKDSVDELLGAPSASTGMP